MKLTVLAVSKVCPFKQQFDTELEIRYMIECEYAQVTVDTFVRLTHLSIVWWWFPIMFHHFLVS